VTLIEAHEGTKDFDTALVWDLLKERTVPVLVYGAAGAGKSTLVRILTGDTNAKTSHGVAGTTKETPCKAPSGVCLIDMPGITIPGLEIVTKDSVMAWVEGTAREWKEASAWNARIRDLEERLRSQEARRRPLAVLYCVNATARVHPERIKELIARPHTLLVPTCIVLTNIYGASNEARATIEAELQKLIEEVGFNKRGQLVQFVQVNSEQFSSGAAKHHQKGIAELVTTLLGHLDPSDALTFSRKRNMFGLGSSGMTDNEKAAVRESFNPQDPIAKGIRELEPTYSTAVSPRRAPRGDRAKRARHQ